MGFAFDEVDTGLDDEEDENVDGLKDDLESTKQLLELEVRSKKLLEKDNKRLQQELERLRAEFNKMRPDGEAGAEPETPSQARRNSVTSRRKQSIVKLQQITDEKKSNNNAALSVFKLALEKNAVKNGALSKERLKVVYKSVDFDADSVLDKVAYEVLSKDIKKARS